MDAQAHLIFVYNADTGTFNTLADMGHKMFSPDTYACSLCSITHGVFREKAEWKDFVASLPMECVFLHRDEFEARYPEYQDRLPGVFIETTDGISLCLSANQLDSCNDMQDLKQLISTHCTYQPEESPDEMAHSTDAAYFRQHTS